MKETNRASTAKILSIYIYMSVCVCTRTHNTTYRQPLRVPTSAHHRYKWTIKLMEVSGQSTCSANILTKLSWSQLREIPLRQATTQPHFEQLYRGTSKRAG